MFMKIVWVSVTDTLVYKLVCLMKRVESGVVLGCRSNCVLGLWNFQYSRHWVEGLDDILSV